MTASERDTPSSEDDEARPLVGIPMLVGFAAALATIIAVVFPTRAQYANLTSVDKPDKYSLAYVSVLTRANPGDVELRMLYVKQLAALGRYREADDVLAPAIADPRASLAAKNLRFDIRLADARSQPEGSTTRRIAFEAVTDMLDVLLPLPHPLGRLRELSGIALELGRPALAAEYVLRLMDASRPEARPALRAEAAQWYRAAGEGAKAARYYAEAAVGENDVGRAKAHAMLALDALEAQNDPNGAADLATAYARRWWDDAQVVERAASLATACSRAKAARDFGRRLMELRPEGEALLRVQALRELRAGDPHAALVLVRKLVARHPDDELLREAEARVAEWAGDAPLALQDWLWLLGRGVTPKGLQL